VAYQIAFKPAFFRALKNLPKKTLAEMDQAVKAIQKAPHLVPAKPLQGFKNLFRLRLGDYRLVFNRDDENKKILFILFAHRKDIYRHLKK
jgi:mRNA interferase RelE/StbE